MAFWLFVNAIVGPIGIKALYKTEDFFVGQSINENGEIYGTHPKVTPVLSAWKKSFKGIKLSRAKFESRPDKGFFGKNFSRIFNYIECYIFRLIFVAIIIMGILFPAAIVVNSTISLALAITSWAWIPFTLLLRVFLNVFIYDFDFDYKNYLYYYRARN